jgi:hypothetical protein
MAAVPMRKLYPRQETNKPTNDGLERGVKHTEYFCIIHFLGPQTKQERNHHTEYGQAKGSGYH